MRTLRHSQHLLRRFTMKKTIRNSALALVAAAAFAVSMPAHAGIAGSDPQPPLNNSGSSSINVVLAALTTLAL
jgi:hypothetical protein